MLIPYRELKYNGMGYMLHDHRINIKTKTTRNYSYKTIFWAMCILENIGTIFARMIEGGLSAFVEHVL